MSRRESVAAQKLSDPDGSDGDFDDFVEIADDDDDPDSDFEESKEEKYPKKKTKTKTKAKTVVVLSKPTPHLPIPHREYDPVVKLTFGNCIYIIKLIRADKLADSNFKKLNYLGSTILFNHRIRQHLGHIGGGAKITTNNLGDGKFVWFPICILHSTEGATKANAAKAESKIDEDDGASGSDELDELDDPLRELTVSEIRQIEYKIKHSVLSLGDGTNARFAMRKADGNLVHEKVRKMIILVNLPKWTKKCTRSAVGVPLTISWFMPDEMPSSQYAYLPPYVKEEIIDNYVLPTPPKVIRARKPRTRKRRTSASSAKRGGKRRKTK